MNDDLEQLEYDQTELKHTKDEIEVLIDHYTDQLRHCENPDITTTVLIRKENQERKLVKINEEIKNKAITILNFNN